MKIWEKWREVWQVQVATFFKLILFSCVIGVTVGTVGAFFHRAIESVTLLRTENPWLLYLLPLVGVVIIWMYKLCDMEKDRGTNFVLTAVRENEPMHLRTAPLIFLSTVLTHLAGGSSGREGAALQLGGAISGKIGQWMKLDDKDNRIITMCGMSAGFAALFGTPITAAIFAMEVVSVGVMYYSAILPCILGAIVASMTAGALGGQATFFALKFVPEISIVVLLKVLALGTLCAILSVVFCHMMKITPKIYAKYLPRPGVRAAVGGGIIIVLTLLCGTTDYNGAGIEVIARAIDGQAVWYAFLLKMLFTAVTLGAGFKGGEIVPVFFTGATFGCVAGQLLRLPASFGAGVGMAAVFCGVTNCPMTSLVLAYELFGGEGLTLFALALAVSYLLSGYYSLYSEQKIIYSKLKPEFIDKKAH